MIDHDPLAKAAQTRAEALIGHPLDTAPSTALANHSLHQRAKSSVESFLDSNPKAFVKNQGCSKAASDRPDPLSS